MADWYLEGYFGDDEKIRQLHLTNLPQVIGRDPNLPLRIDLPSTSRNHAKIEYINCELIISDMSSSNGTFVNRTRISKPTPIDHGDIIHLGLAEMRIIDKDHSSITIPPRIITRSHDKTRMLDGKSALSKKFPTGIQELEKLIATGSIQVLFQSIVRADDMSLFGWESLGRGTHADLPSSPAELFEIAESVNQEITLSELMRNEGIKTAVKYKLKGDIQVNTHPNELKNPDRLIANIRGLRKRFGNVLITLEIHEQAVTGQGDLLKTISKEMRKIRIKLAFDDFGVGQSRLTELVEIQPDIVKFDKALIQNIDSGDPARLNLLKHLKELTTDLKIATLAECIDSPGEYAVCKQLGFDLYQGYFISDPKPAHEL